MAVKEVVGYIECPTCNFKDMEVKIDKRGNAFAYCPDCDQQLFTHKKRKSDLMLARMRKVSGEPEPEAASETAAVPETSSHKERRRENFL